MTQHRRMSLLGIIVIFPPVAVRLVALCSEHAVEHRGDEVELAVSSLAWHKFALCQTFSIRIHEPT